VFISKGRQGTSNPTLARMPRGVEDLEWWAETFPWGTPENVGRLTLEQYEWFPRIWAARQNARRKLAELEQKRNAG
jgi:hypothetical protein